MFEGVWKGLENWRTLDYFVYLPLFVVGETFWQRKLTSSETFQRKMVGEEAKESRLKERRRKKEREKERSEITGIKNKI